jgi:hypothetical protein
MSPEFPANYFVYGHFLDPREHPDYDRRHVRPPSWETFAGQVHFAALREFDIRDGRIVGYVEEIEKYTQKYELGDVLWIRYPILFAENLEHLIDEVRRRQIFLFDIWGYVPGSGLGGPWQQFQAPAGVFALLESKLSDHWLGMDNGEQDGRYVGTYANEFYPSSNDRFEQYLNFHRHFERITNQLGSKMASLVSLNFGHYFLREGLYTLIGAETAQALPNGQVYYSFLRGAGKQYGVLWFGNASVYNRWGWKRYGRPHEDHGPTKGTSLSLMKRLMYSQILYNSVLVGFESGFFTTGDSSETSNASASEELSPIGLIQQSAGRWLRDAGKPGPMLTPFALMIDFLAGWTFPRHLYSEELYRVWGNVPYSAGDYLTDGLLDMLYPGYQDSSFFHDETGFLTATPYGDGADCILSDAPGWLLARYPILLIAGELEGGAEVRDKLESYVRNGGHLLITAGNLPKLPGGLAGIHAKKSLTHFGPRQRVSVGETWLVEDNPFDICALTFPASGRVLGETSGLPVVIQSSFGKGRVTVFASPFGVAFPEATTAPQGFTKDVRSEIDKPLVKPYPLLNVIRHTLDKALRNQMLFDTGRDLSLITCRKGPGEYTLGVSNPSWQQKPLNIVSCCGPIESLHEVHLDQSEKHATGYLPEGLEKMDLGVSDAKNIAGGDMRIFAVRVREENVEELPHIAPPARPHGRALPLRGTRSIQEEVLARPSFFENFDSVVVDWRYLHGRERIQLQRESGWIKLQRLKLLIDLTSGINLFPDLRLIDNLRQDYSASLETILEVISKMKILSAKDLILSLHRYPENNFSEEQTWRSFEETLRHLCQQADRQGIRVHLRLRSSSPPANLKTALNFLDRVNAPNFGLAVSTPFLSLTTHNLPETKALLQGKVGLWLLNTCETDVAGKVWNENAPIRESREPQSVADVLSIAPEVLVVFDVVYKDHDDEYLDTLFLREALA